MVPKKKKVTLSVNSEVYDEFHAFCEKNAVMMSRKIEIWMEEFLEENKSKKREK